MKLSRRRLLTAAAQNGFGFLLSFSLLRQVSFPKVPRFSDEFLRRYAGAATFEFGPGKGGAIGYGIYRAGLYGWLTEFYKATGRLPTGEHEILIKGGTTVGFWISGDIRFPARFPKHPWDVA